MLGITQPRARIPDLPLWTVVLASALTSPVSGSLPFKAASWDFPGGLVVRIPGFHCGGLGSIPGRGRFHKLRGAAQKKSCILPISRAGLVRSQWWHVTRHRCWLPAPPHESMTLASGVPSGTHEDEAQSQALKQQEGCTVCFPSDPPEVLR